MNLFLILNILAAFSINEAFSRKWSKKKSLKPQASDEERCQSGNGSSYRGFVSKSASGRRCLKWSWFENPWGVVKGIESHNYCRNPDQDVMPWCYVRKGRRFVRELCNVPKCATPTVKPPPSAVDTELTCGERSEKKTRKIVGGSFITIESNPWVAAIFSRSFLCGGSLIAPCWVLTAAHCFTDGEHTNVKRLSVYLGKSAINDTGDREQKFTVEKLILHQNFNKSNFDNDIALLKIKTKDGRCAAQSASARTVCLPPFHTRLPAEFQCIIAGFGKERSNAWGYSQLLKQAPVKLTTQSYCMSTLYNKNVITDNMFCARSPDWSTDACQGDSGGPLVCEISGRMFLYGIVSWGDGCALENKPGVYTQVTNYNSWIAEKTKQPRYTEGVMYPIK